MKKLLLVVDYQNDFVDGSLGFPQAKTLEPVIAEKIKAYRAEGNDVAFTMDTHHSDYLSTQEGRNLPIPHTVKGTDGWNLYGSIEGLQHPEDKVFEKPVFGSAELFDYLRANPYDSIELVGVVAHICVLSNAVLAKAALPEAEVIIDAAGTASADPSMCEKALDVLEGVQCTVINRA